VLHGPRGRPVDGRVVIRSFQCTGSTKAPLGEAHIPGPSQASQQLILVELKQWEPPGPDLHRPGGTTLHRVFPRRFVLQHGWYPIGRPQIDLAAHLATTFRHFWGSLRATMSSLATVNAHFLYAPSVMAAAQGHCWSTRARVAATAARSVAEVH
jgi:hypothetical protein